MILKHRILPAIFLIFLISLSLTGFSKVVLAEETSAISTKVEVGFDGKARTGFWMPVVVDMENQGPDFDGEIQISADPFPGAVYQPGSVYQSRYGTEVVLPRGSHKHITVYIPYF